MCETPYGIEGKCILGLHRICYGMLREGAKGEEREESSLPGSSPGKLCVLVCAAKESRMRLLVLPVFVCLLYAFVCVTVWLAAYTCLMYVSSLGMCLMGTHFHPC